MVHRELSVFFAVSACLAGTVTADILGTFDAGTEGWLVSGPDPASHIGLQSLSTTNPNWDAGSLRIGDQYNWTWVKAPALFLGNQGGALGKTMSWDILIRASDDFAYPAVALVGANVTLYFDTESPPVGTWHHAEIPLTQGGWRVNHWSAGAFATQAQLLEVLSDLRALYIMTEWKTGPDDTNLDNVFFPGTAASDCPGDLNHDGQVDDADFVIFVGAYNILDCADLSMPAGCPADLTRDGVVEDADFVVFVAAYNELVCP